MVDFSTPKRRSSKSRSNGLFVVALFIVGLVSYAFVENAFWPPHGDHVFAPQSQMVQAPS